MKFVFKPELERAELQNDKNELVKMIILTSGQPLVFLYSEDDTSNELKFHTISFDKANTCIYFDGLQFEKETVMELIEDICVTSFAFVEEFQMEQYLY